MAEPLQNSFANGEILIEVEDNGLARMTLNRPASRNAITLAMWSSFAEAMDRLDRDETVKAIVITGAGNKAFSGGADISEFPKTYGTRESTMVYTGAVADGQAAIAAARKPVIAEIRGACVGGGCGVALCCDLRFAAPDSRFGITPAKLGLSYNFPDTRRLVNAVGPSKAKDILFSGRLLDAEEALRIGLIDRIVAADRLAEEVTAYATRLTTLARSSLRVAKATINSIADGDVGPSDELMEMYWESFAGEDFKEGFTAFLEKRKPNFR